MDSKTKALNNALAHNLGNTLTPELAVGILQSYLNAEEEDRGLVPGNFQPLQVGDYVVRVERFRDCVEEAALLHRQFWVESGQTDQLNPDYAQICQLERLGMYAYFTARLGGDLVGQLAAYVQNCPHTGLLMARDNLLYVAPEHRVGVGKALITYAVDVFASIGVRNMECHTAPDNRVQSMIKRLGFKHTANRYTFKEEQT